MTWLARILLMLLCALRCGMLCAQTDILIEPTGEDELQAGYYPEEVEPDFPANTELPSTPRQDRHSLFLFSGADLFRGPSDTDPASNVGAVFGGNLGLLLPGELGERGCGAQFGASYGVYDWSGRSFAHTTEQQTQTFLTGGLFRRATQGRGFNSGLVYDIMLNQNFGALAQKPTLTQFRGTISYSLDPYNEIGCWATHRDRDFRSGFSLNFFPTATQFRLINQANFFYHHQWELGSETWGWAGIVEQDRLSGAGSLGDWTLGGMAQVPLNDSCALVAGAQYLHPSSRPSATAALDSSWNVSIGFAFYPSFQARRDGFACGDARPLQPLANNGSMLVDYLETRPGITLVGP
jgi:hypothetical protein